MQDFGGHPPFAHNPHVYGGVDPDAVVRDAAADEVADEDARVDVDGDGEITGYEVFTKADLITECEQRGLSTSGNKPDLVRRLVEHDAAQDNAAQDSS